MCSEQIFLACSNWDRGDVPCIHPISYGGLRCPRVELDAYFLVNRENSVSFVFRSRWHTKWDSHDYSKIQRIETGLFDLALPVITPPLISGHHFTIEARSISIALPISLGIHSIYHRYKTIRKATQQEKAYYILYLPTLFRLRHSYSSRKAYLWSRYPYQHSV